MILNQNICFISPLILSFRVTEKRRCVSNLPGYGDRFDFFILDGDTLVFIDFRADRMRQITEAFGIQRHFETDVVPKDLVS